MPPLNFYKDQVDYSSYISYAGSNNVASRFSSPFDVDSVNGEAHRKGSHIPSDQPLFLNFTADLNPQSGAKKQKAKKKNSYKVNGVNILNRKSLDSSTALERLQKRRENHNSVERKRRDNINATIMEISELLPGPVSTSSKPNKGNILKLASKFIRELKYEVKTLKNEIRILKGEEPLEEEEEDIKEVRKRKNVDQESSDESDDNVNEEKDDQDMDNDGNIYSSADPSRQVSPELTPDVDTSNDNCKQSQSPEKPTLETVSSVEKIEGHSEPGLSGELSNSNFSVNTSKGHAAHENISQATSTPNHQTEFDSPENIGFHHSDKLPGYPILGGGKRHRADTYALPGISQFPSLTTTLSHMHTFSVSPRQSVPVSPFGFQLPSSSHPAAPTTSTNNQSHLVNHMMPMSNYQPHPHARGPPNMMFREFNGNMNMY